MYAAGIYVLLCMYVHLRAGRRELGYQADNRAKRGKHQDAGVCMLTNVCMQDAPVQMARRCVHNSRQHTQQHMHRENLEPWAPVWKMLSLRVVQHSGAL